MTRLWQRASGRPDGLPPAVVVEVVEAAERRERAQTDRVREENLRAGVNPHLASQQHVARY